MSLLPHMLKNLTRQSSTEGVRAEQEQEQADIAFSPKTALAACQIATSPLALAESTVPLLAILFLLLCRQGQSDPGSIPGCQQARVPASHQLKGGDEQAARVSTHGQ